jgi:hypothetical protein
VSFKTWSPARPPGCRKSFIVRGESPDTGIVMY